MRSSLSFWPCSALIAILAGCAAGQGGGGYVPPARDAGTSSSGLTAGGAEAEPDTASGVAEFTTNTGQANGIASDGMGHEFVGAEEPSPSLLQFDEHTHAIKQFNLPKPATGMYALARQGTTAMWFTDDRVVGFMTLSNHQFQEFKVPTQGAGIEGIGAGAGHRMWLTEAHGGKVGRISTTNHGISEYALPAPSHPLGIVLGNDGAMWFANYQSIDRITSSGQLTEYSVGSNYPTGVTTGPDGAIWFAGESDQNGALIGRIDLNTHTRKIAKYGAGSGATIGIVTRGSELWLTAPDANKIDRYDPGSHVVYRRSLPKGYTDPFGIALGADDQLWFTNSGPQGSAIGKLCPSMTSSACKTSP
jgi:streptogramin lyase